MLIKTENSCCWFGHNFALFENWYNLHWFSTIASLGNSLPVRFGGPDEEILTKPYLYTFEEYRSMRENLEISS